MNEHYKLVDFEHYCGTCKHRDDPESSDVCNDCLYEPARVETHKPVNYEPDESRKKQAL